MWWKTHKGESGTQARVKAAVRDPTPHSSPHMLYCLKFQEEGNAVPSTKSPSAKAGHRNRTVFTVAVPSHGVEDVADEGFAVRVVPTERAPKPMQASRCVNFPRFFDYIVVIACSLFGRCWSRLL